MRRFAVFLAMLCSFGSPAALADPGVSLTPPRPVIPEAMRGMMQPPPPRMTGPDKGDAIQVNFVAPVTTSTMASLVKTIQDANTLGFKRAVIFISSPGGSVRAARFAVSAMRATPMKIDTVVAADVGSAAVALYCAGEDRFFDPSGVLFLHQMGGYHDLSLKSIEADTQRSQIYRDWYQGLLRECSGYDELPEDFDFSVRDRILDAADAKRLNIVNTDFEDLKLVDYGMTTFNIIDHPMPMMFQPPMPN